MIETELSEWSPILPVILTVRKSFNFFNREYDYCPIWTTSPVATIITKTKFETKWLKVQMFGAKDNRFLSEVHKTRDPFKCNCPIITDVMTRTV